MKYCPTPCQKKKKKKAEKKSKKTNKETHNKRTKYTQKPQTNNKNNNQVNKHVRIPTKIILFFFSFCKFIATHGGGGSNTMVPTHWCQITNNS